MHINNKFSSPNCDIRSQKIEYIIVHYTEMMFQEALDKLTDESSKVSAHYLIRKDGEVFQLVDDANIAWHAGQSSWNGATSLNQNSIGIELDNLGDGPFNDIQMQSCIKLSKKLMANYNISARNFIGHSDVAPERKIDPGIFFDWELCAQNGLGIWHDLQGGQGSEDLLVYGDKGPRVKVLQLNLAKLGYMVNVTAIFDMQTNFAIRAFQSKFYPERIQQKGMDFYRNNDSNYSWCSFSEEILQKLLLLYFA